MEVLHQKIEQGLYKPGHPIPSERILCQTYGISRITVRQAISDMINEGTLYRKQGKGTFIAQRKINQGLVRFVNFSKTVLDLGMNPATKILGNDIVPADIQLARILDIPATDRVLRLTLLGMADQSPLVLYESYFPLLIGKKLAGEAIRRERDGIPFSTYDLYGESSRLLPAKVNQTLEAVTADDSLASLLHLKKGAPILMITSLFLAADQRPLEFRKAMYRGDFYKFHITREFS